MISLSSDDMRVWLDPLGARLAGIWLAGFPHSLVLGPCDTANLSAPEFTYFGVLVGPIANRVAGATAQIDGTNWQMRPNEGSTALHSGPDGIHARTWTTGSVTESEARFATELAHGECGLPGQRRITAIYRLSGTSLELEVNATTNRLTAMNIAHHPYWNLSGQRTIADHQLEIPADQVVALDPANLPTGQLQAVEDTQYDFRAARALPTQIPLDANLCLAQSRRAIPERAAVLTAPNAPKLEIETTEPGLQLYNGIGLGASVDVPLHDARQLTSCAGVALEPQGWPDALRHVGFPSILLKPGETYRQITRYRLSRELT
ncbi:MAG: aldose epimerase family protein [Pseudomonadota bacterium]